MRCPQWKVQLFFIRSPKTDNNKNQDNTQLKNKKLITNQYNKKKKDKDTYNKSILNAASIDNNEQIKNQPT